jgi:hypothetical protein
MPGGGFPGRLRCWEIRAGQGSALLSIDRSTLDGLAVAGTVLGALGLATAGAAFVRLGRLRRTQAVLELPEGGQEPVLSLLDRQASAVAGLRAELAGLRAEVDAARAELSAAIRHVAVVRYDAFADMGGRMSFSTALLDDDGDGLVLTAINGRTETRSYAKGVKAGTSEQSLSPEEEQVIAAALGGESPSGRAPG